MAKAAVVLLLIALSTAAVQAQKSTTAKTDFQGALEKNGYKLAAALFDIANLTAPLSKPNARYTVLVPTDAAIEAFLKQMGLTVDGLKKRPLLAKQLAAQHLILEGNVRPQELFANSPARIVATAARKPNNLLFKKSGDQVTVTDIQGNTAKVQKYFVIDPEKTAHPVDKVLMPDTVYFNFDDLCKFRPLTIKDFCNAVEYAGMKSTLSDSKLDATVFVPNNQAFTKAIDLSKGQIPSEAKAADILKYHVVSGYHTLGSGLSTSLRNGVPDKTLEGQTITVNYERVTPAAGSSRKLPYAKAIVTTTSGQKANVLKSNVHVGTALAQGIDTVLQPGGTSFAAAKPAAATKPAAAKTTGRRLMQAGWGFSGGPTAEGDAAAGNIQAAADGDESVAGAADRSTYGASELSVPGAANLADEGINPW